MESVKVQGRGPTVMTATEVLKGSPSRFAESPPGNREAMKPPSGANSDLILFPSSDFLPVVQPGAQSAGGP